MNLQTRKLNLIQFVASLEDEKVLKKIESSLGLEYSNSKEFSVEKLLKRAELSNKEYISGKFSTQEDLQLESEKW
jgi:hypothetical protein